MDGTSFTLGPPCATRLCQGWLGWVGRTLTSLSGTSRAGSRDLSLSLCTSHALLIAGLVTRGTQDHDTGQNTVAKANLWLEKSTLHPLGVHT